MKTAATLDHSQKAIAPVLKNADATILDYSQKAISIWRKNQIIFSISTDLIAAASIPKPIECGAHQEM